MRRLPILTVLALTLTILGFACGGGGDDRSEIVPIPGNSELVVGPNRFALALIDEDNSPIFGAPGTSVHLRFLYQEELRSEHDAAFTWAIPDANGFFVTMVEFDEAGEWTAEATLTRDGGEEQVTFTFPVQETSLLPNVGDAAPATENLTLAEEPNIKRLSTDEDPELALYQLSIADALQSGRPTVIVFATPAFCQTRFCGPVVDNVKDVRAQFIDRANFIHIEPFELDDNGELVSSGGGGPVVAAATEEWHLQTEPWIFVVSADGIIAARFEGAAGVSELAEAVQSALG